MVLLQQPQSATRGHSGISEKTPTGGNLDGYAISAVSLIFQLAETSINGSLLQFDVLQKISANHPPVETRYLWAFPPVIRQLIFGRKRLFPPVRQSPL